MNFLNIPWWACLIAFVCLWIVMIVVHTKTRGIWGLLYVVAWVIAATALILCITRMIPR